MFSQKQLEILKTAVNSLMDDMDEFPNDYTENYKHDVAVVLEQIEIELILKTL